MRPRGPRGFLPHVATGVGARRLAHAARCLEARGSPDAAAAAAGCRVAGSVVGPPPSADVLSSGGRRARDFERAQACLDGWRHRSALPEHPGQTGGGACEGGQ